MPSHSSNSSNSRHILVTGSAGAIGQPVCRELLARGYAVRGFDRVPSPELPDAVIADLTNADALHQAAQGMDALIHLAATPEDEDFVTQLVPNNVIGLYNMFEAARQAGVRRLVVASSVHVINGMWRKSRKDLIRASEGEATRTFYGLTKILAEKMAWTYHRNNKFMSVVVVRPGLLPRNEEHLAAAARNQHIYLSPGDAGRFFAQAVEATNISYVVLFAASKPAGTPVLDLEEARQSIGYEPQDTWPQGLEELPFNTRTYREVAREK